MDFPIKILEPSHYDDLIELWKSCDLPHRPTGRDSREAITRQMRRDDTRFWGMFDGRRLIAAVIADSNGRKGWINRLAVHPDYRGKGLAQKLIDECERFFEGLGLKVFGALIKDDNVSSFSAFGKAGFSRADEVTYWSKRGSEAD